MKNFYRKSLEKIKLFILIAAVLFFKTTMAQNCCPQVTNGLLTYYSFCGNANDLSGNGHDGTVHGAALTTDRFGNPNSAYQFNGTSDYISVPDNSSLRLSNTDFTISAWVYEASASSTENGILFKRGAGSGDGYNLTIEGSFQSEPGTVNYQVSGGPDPRAISDSVLALNSWQHILVTYNLNLQTVNIYINGILNSTTTAMPSPNAATTAALWIGSDPAGSPYFFNGKIDDVSLYNRILTPSEIQLLLGNNAVCSSNCLIASYPFSGNAADTSGNNFNGTVHGATLTTDRFGNPNSAYQFNGTSDYISVPDNSSLRLSNTDFTISTWVYQTSLSSTENGILFKRGSGSGDGYNLTIEGSSQTEPGAVNYQVSGGPDPRAISDSAIALNSWKQIVATYNLSLQRLKIYIDGALNSTTTSIPSPNALTTAALWIGSDPAGSPYFFHGKIDDVQLYSCAFSDSEVAVNYNGAATGISESFNTSGFYVYPSPASAYLNIRIPALKGKVFFQICDVIGKIVSNEMAYATGSAGTKQIDISAFPPGIYFLRINAEGKFLIKKIIKE